MPSLRDDLAYMQAAVQDAISVLGGTICVNFSRIAKNRRLSVI